MHLQPEGAEAVRRILQIDDTPTDELGAAADAHMNKVIGDRRRLARRPWGDLTVSR